MWYLEYYSSSTFSCTKVKPTMSMGSERERGELVARRREAENRPQLNITSITEENASLAMYLLDHLKEVTLPRSTCA